MNDKTKNAATRPFRVNYTYSGKNGQLRAGSIIVEANTVQEANKIADERLPSFGLQHHRIISTKEY